VVLDEQLARQVVDRDGESLGARAKDEHRLVVLREQAQARGRVLAEMQESSQALAERREARVVLGGEVEAALRLLQEQGFSLMARRRGRGNIGVRYDRVTIYTARQRLLPRRIA